MKKIWISLLVCSELVVSSQVWAEVLPWNLGLSVKRAIEVAPEIKKSDAEISQQKGRLESASAWENPTFSIQVDDRLGIEDAEGGYDVTQVSISQPISFRRIGHQKRFAESEIASAMENRQRDQLILERAIAQQFHTLQLAVSKYQLAKERLEKARNYQSSGTNNNGNDDPLIRYLTPLEKMRLNIVLQAAIQELEVAEGEYNETLMSFKSMLAIPVDDDVKLTKLLPPEGATSLEELNKALMTHPALEALKHSVRSAQDLIDVKKSKRFNDPTISIYQGKDFLANGRENVTGVALSLQMPLWNKNNGETSQARFFVHQVQAELEIEQRKLKTDLRKSYLHSNHLIEQSEHYRKNLLQPALQVFKLTEKGFQSGELDILTLIDANNTYFDTQERYFELLAESWLELAEVRKSAGVFLLDAELANNLNEGK